MEYFSLKGAVLSKSHKHDSWLQDINARQRNIVFPDTAQNEARFWRNLYEGKEPLSKVQKAGIAVMFLAAIGLGVALTSSAFDFSSDNRWYIAILVGATDWIIALALLGGFLLLLRWREASRRQRN